MNLDYFFGSNENEKIVKYKNDSKGASTFGSLFFLVRLKKRIKNGMKIWNA